jgi:hypothetical protein
MEIFLLWIFFVVVDANIPLERSFDNAITSRSPASEGRDSSAEDHRLPTLGTSHRHYALEIR